MMNLNLLAPKTERYNIGPSAVFISDLLNAGRTYLKLTVTHTGTGRSNYELHMSKPVILYREN